MIRTLLLLLYASFAAAGSTPPAQCSNFCAESEVLSWETGTTLEYSYSGWAETTLSNQRNQAATGLSLNATVVVRTVSPCEISLELRDVELSGESRGSRYVDLLTKEQVRASVQAGRVEAVCAAHADSPDQRWALNVKKAILSAFQLPLKSLESTAVVTVHETDISGICRTSYQSLKLDDSTLVTKHKDLTQCSGRFDEVDLELPKSGFPTATTPLLKGSQNCIQTIKEGQLVFSHCKESHVFQPFSANNGSDGVTTAVHQTITLQNTTTDDGFLEPLQSPFVRSSLLFEYGNNDKMMTSEKQIELLEETKSTLKELAGESATLSVRANTANLFGKLVRAMEKLDEKNLQALVIDLEMTDVERVFVMDALPTLDTPAGISLMTDIYTEREKQIPKIKMWLEKNAAPWFASLANTRRMEISSIKKLQKLLTYALIGFASESDVPSIVLGITAASRTYCEENGGVGTCHRTIHEIIATLERVFVPEFHANEKTLILASKGLGNIGVFDNAVENIKNTMQNESASMELRLAAFDAFRRTPCSRLDIPTFLAVYTDTNKDTELRIAAYLVAVRCPSSGVVRAIKRALSYETVNQVGSFVWTHLTNSQESTSKNKKVLREILANEFLQNKFNTDARQFSRNFEGSHYFESLKLGANVDANVIFSPRSYLPRSAMLNLTVDLFGHSVNLFEVGGRAEGFEPMIEQLFTKRGLFENEAVENFLKNSRKDEQYDKVRNITAPMRKIAKPKANAFLRFNGLEISYFELESILNNAYRFNIHPKDLLRNLVSRKEFEFTRSLTLIDVRKEIPTLIGLPLQLVLNGTASVKVGLQGHFEMTNSGVELSGYVAPSASIDIAGTISMGQDEFEQGVKIKANLYTHTAVDAQLTFAKDGKLSIQSHTKEDKQTIVDLKVERLVFNGHQEEKIADLIDQRENSHFCTGEWVDSLLGVKFCSDVGYPNSTLLENKPTFPLNGDTHVTITMEKTDPNFRAYEFSTSWTHVPGVKYDYSFYFDRVGSEMANKKRAIALVYDKVTGVALASLDFPEKQVEISVLWDSKDFSAAELILSYDRVTYTNILAKLNHQKNIMQNTKEQYGKIEPEIKFKVRTLPEFHLKGIINYSGKSKLTAELNLSGLTKQPILLAADYYADMHSGAMNARVSVDSQFITWDVKANAKITPSSLGLRINGVYNLTEETQHTLEIMTKYNWNQQGALRKVFLNLKSQLSQWPEYSGQLQTDMMLSKGYYESNTRLVLTDEEWNITQRFQATGTADLWIKHTIVCDTQKINFLLEHRHKFVPESFSTTTQLNVNDKRHANCHLDYKYIQGDGVTFAAESKLIWPHFTFANGEGPYLQSRLRQIFPGEYEAFLISQWTDGQQPLKINAEYKDKSTQKKISHSLESVVTGILDFNETRVLGVKGNFEAISNEAKVDAAVSVGGEQKCAVDFKYDVDGLGEKNVAAKMSLWPTRENQKDYELNGSYLKSTVETAASLDLKMSRHLAFSFRTSNDNDRASFFWDKTRDPTKNITVMVEYPKLNEIAANLLIPGQNITVAGFMRYISATSKSNDSVHLSGHFVGGKVLWSPDNELAVSTSYKGNLNLGLELFAELSTKGIPVIGDQLRVLEGEYVVPGDSEGGKLTVKHTWRNSLLNLENMEAQILIAKKNNELSLEFYLMSTLWDPKVVTGSFKNVFKNWNNFNGNVSGFCGQEGLVLAWDWNMNNGVNLEIESSWAKIASTKMELKYNVLSKTNVGLYKNWLFFKHGDDIWRGDMNNKKEKTNGVLDFELELSVLTPMVDFNQHELLAALQWNKYNVNCTGKISTPLVGDYSFNISNHELSDLEKMQGQVTIYSADTIAAELKVIANAIPISQGLVLDIEIAIPEIMSVKTEVDVELKEHGGLGKVNFHNNNKLLHDFRISYNNEQLENDGVKFDLEFSGYSYLIMPSRWKTKVKHEGAKMNHTSYLEINRLAVEHKFEYLGDDSWILKQVGLADQKEVMKLSMDHNGLMNCAHSFHVMGTDAIEIASKFQLGYVNINFMNNIFQIHTRITDEDEFKTNTKIYASHKLYATMVTSTYLKYKNDDNGLESAIISLDIDSVGTNAKARVNIDAWRQVTGNLQVKYSMLKMDLNLDVLSPNNTLHISVFNGDNKEISLDTFVYYGMPTAEVGLLLECQSYILKVVGDGAMDENMTVYAKVQIEDNKNIGLFPMLIDGKWNLPKESEEINTGGILSVKTLNQGEIQFTGKAKLEEFHKSVNANVKVSKIGGNEVENDYGVVMRYENQNKHYIFANCKRNDEKYEAEFMLAEMLLEAKLETPLDNYKYMSLKAGVTEISEQEKRFLEFIKNDYRLDAELIFSKVFSKSQMVGIAKSNNGFEVEAVVDKIETESSTDVGFQVQLNNYSKIEAGAYLQYEIGNLNITANLTKDGNTSRMRSVIYNTPQVKSFAIKSEYQQKTYELEIYSSIENELTYEQGFKIDTQGLQSEFRYEKSNNASIAFLNYQEQKLQCELKGNTRVGVLTVLHTSDKSVSEIKATYDFNDKVSTMIEAYLNEQKAKYRVNVNNDMSGQPLKIQVIFNPRNGPLHLSYRFKDIQYLLEGMYTETADKIITTAAIVTPYFETTSLNVSYDFENSKKVIEFRFDYGTDFYEIVSQVFVDGSYSVNLNLDAKSSVPDYEKIMVTGGFKNDEKFVGDFKMEFPLETYTIGVESVPEKTCNLKIETRDHTFNVNYEKQEEANFVEFYRDSKQIFNATFNLANETLQTTIMTPHEKYNNLTMYIGYGSNLPSKKLVIHKNNDMVFKAHMYPLDQEELNSGSGIMATIYQGDQKFVYDAQFSIDNPVFIILKQHETGNVTRDILHFSLNVTDENTASGRAEILLPISPNTKLLARGHVQIESKNAEFKMSYKFDEEEENNFAIHYTTYTDNYNIYNIVTNLTTPFKGYENMTLRITSSWTETVVKFTSQLPSYENIALVAVHRLEGPQKELLVQYQNMQKSIFFVKALFLNQPSNKRIELKTRTPFLNGQALASNNGSVMEVMLEHESVVLCQIVSKFEDMHNGKRYEFTFKKPEKKFLLESNYVNELDLFFHFNASLDEKQIAKIDMKMDALGNIISKISILEDQQYLISGLVNWLTKSLQLTVTNEKAFNAKISFELQKLGYLKITSTEIQHDIAVEWNFSDQLIGFNVTRERTMSMRFETSNTHASIELDRKGVVHSFTFGQMKSNGWPNVYLAIVWENETIIDFLHDFLTDLHLLIMKTRLTSPYLGSHKNMKFNLTLKTRDVIQMEAEFKWRPKDLTTFSASVQLDKLISRATVTFVSPFTSNFTFNAHYDFSATEKTFEILYDLGSRVSLNGHIVPSGIDQSLLVKLITPIAGFTEVELSGYHKVIGKTHRAELQFIRENERKNIEIFSDQSNLKAIINTPETRWALNMNYLYSHDTHNIDGAIQWGGASDVVRFDIQFKPNAKLFIDVNGPDNMKYTIDLKMAWTHEKKTIELVLQKNLITTEITASVSTKNDVHMLVGMIKSPLFHYIKVSALADVSSNELGGALQINEDIFIVKASKVQENSYQITLREDDVEKIALDIAFEGDFAQGLKFYVECRTPKFKFSTQGAITLRDEKTRFSTSLTWGAQEESVFFSFNKEELTEIELKLNTLQVPESDLYLSYGQNTIAAMLRNQSDTYKGLCKFQLENVYSVNGTFEINGVNYEVFTYYDPREIQAHAIYVWPKNRKIEANIILRPGDISIALKTPYEQYTNIQVNGKYSELMSYNDYQLASKADAKWNDYLISLTGVIKSSHNNYGLKGKLTWDNKNEIKLNFGVSDGRLLSFALTTPLKGIAHFSAQLEALVQRQTVTGIRGTIRTPFEKLPILNFTFNKADDLIEMEFAFDTQTYKNVSIHTKLRSKNSNYLYMQINTPFVNKVKRFIVDARSNRMLNRNGLGTKITVQLDENVYEIFNNYTIVNGKLDSYVYMRGPSNRINPIIARFGGKFEMSSLKELDVESYYNDALLSLKYNLTKDITLSGKANLSPIIKLPNMEISVLLVRSNHFEGKCDYAFGDFTGNALIKNKLNDNSLETILYLNLPKILKYPLQVELTANYLQPRLQFNGFASYMAEHKLELVMVQTSFRTNLNAQLNSAFFKGTNKFDLTLSSGALSVSMNDEIKITGFKKSNQLILTLSQISKNQDHTVTYNWDLSKPPTFEIILDSPILSSKRATFSATYMGPLKGVNIKLVSGSESMRLDYNVINKNDSMGLKVVLGNAQAQIFNFAAHLDKIENGHDVVAELEIFEINYKAALKYSLPVKNMGPNLDANLFLSLPYLFPVKSLVMDVKTGKVENTYIIAANISLDNQHLELQGKMSEDLAIIKINSNFEEVKSFTMETYYGVEGDQKTVKAEIFVNEESILKANLTSLKLPNGFILQIESISKIKDFEEMNLKLTIPSELRYSLIATFELRGSTPYDVHFVLSSHTGYTNLELKLTGLAVTMYLTSNQGFFSYKTKYDDFSMKIYSKSSGHQLDSEVTVNSGQTQLFKAGLFGMYHNQSEFYILMSTNCVYESMPDAVLYMGAKKSEIKFGTEFDYKQGDKDSYSVIINHFIETASDFDIGLTVESSGEEKFTTKLTHILKDDFYIALAQVNRDVIKITKIEQNPATLVTGTVKCGEFSTEISGKLANEENSKAADLKLTWNGDLYQLGGSYNYSEEEHINVKLNVNSPQTGQNIGIFDFTKPTNLYILFDRNQSPCLIVELNSEKVRSKYLLLNTTDIKFMLSEFYNNKSYELMSSALFDGSNYLAQYESENFPDSPSSYRTNTTITVPTRTVGLSMEKIISESRNVSQCYVSWESLDRRVGYTIDVSKDNYKTNLKAAIEIPNRAVDFKTHYKHMEIPDEVTDFEYGIQWNWNSKLRETPITFLTTIKLDHEQKTAYHYSVLAHPSFNSTFVVDGQLNKPNMYDNFFFVKMGPVCDGKMTPTLTTKLNMTRKSASSEYHLVMEHPGSNLLQQWDVQLNYENGLGATITLLHGSKRSYSSINFNFNNQLNKAELGFVNNELNADVSAQIIMDRQNKKYGVLSSCSFDMLMPPMTASAIFERPESSHWLLNTEVNLSPERAYLVEAKFTPYHISAMVATSEYKELHTGLQAALTLNTTETISFVGKYQPAIWRNFTHDVQEPVETAKTTMQQILNAFKTILHDELIFAGIAKSVEVNSAYRKVVEHTTAEWSSVRQDIASFKQLIKQLYEKDTFYMRMICSYVERIFTYGYPQINNGLQEVYEAMRTLFTKTVPSLLTTIYNATIEPFVTAFQKFSPTLTKLIRKLMSTWSEIQNGTSSAIRTSMAYMQQGAARISKHSSENLKSMSNWIEETKVWVMNDYIEPGRENLTELAKAIETFFNDINAFIIALPGEIQAYCMSLEEVKFAVEVFKQFSAWSEDFKLIHYATKIQTELNRWYMYILDDLRECIGEYAEILPKILSALKGSYDDVMELPAVKYLRIIYQKVQIKLKYIWEAWEMEKILQEQLIRLGDEVITFAQKISQSNDDYRERILINEEEWSFKYSPKEGEVAGSVSLPITWKRFDQMPTLSEDMNEKYLNFRYSILDKAYEMAAVGGLKWKDLIWRTVMPPFQSNSLISVNGHVITFDGNHYKIKNVLCGSYLYAADYIDHKFALVATYGNDQSNLAGHLSSMTLYTKSGNKMTIDLTQTKIRTDIDGTSRIYMNGSKVELPLYMDGFEISRIGPKVIATSEEGIALHCNIVNGLCSVDLSGWYHGKVAGIAGSLDNEQRNDFAQPDGRVVDSVVEFLEQWKVSTLGDCEIPAKLKPKVKDFGKSMCMQLFSKSDSPMQPCFSRLDPEPFKTMCEQDTVDGTYSDKGPDCLAAEAYLEQCKFVGMELSLPTHCSRCRLAGGRHIQAGDMVVYDSAPKSRTPAPPPIADFVVLIEQGTNRNCLHGNQLYDLPAKIDTVLRVTQGINSTKYALITFGAGKPFTVHTMDGSIWSGRRGIQNALANLKMAQNDEDANNRDLYQALLATASKLHFRPGASKNVILAPCTSCDRSEEASTVFSEASSLLVESDIRLHVLRSDEMIFKRTTVNKKPKHGKINSVMGVDTHGAYTGRRIKGTSLPLASKAIMRQLSIPKDLCTPLAMETNGTLFSAAPLTSRGASDEKRKWLDVWSRRVASSAKPTPCQTCDCMPLPDGSSKLKCHPCISPSIEIFLDEWERALEEAMQEELEEDSGSIEVPDLDVDVTSSDFESERESLNRIRGSLYPGNTFDMDSI